MNNTILSIILVKKSKIIVNMHPLSSFIAQGILFNVSIAFALSLTDGFLETIMKSLLAFTFAYFFLCPNTL